jgi:hypothetical protein
MPFIDCPECGLEVSAQATFCPRCGFPVKKSASRLAGRASRGMAEVPLTSLDLTRSLIGRLVFGGLVLASGIGFDAPPVVLLAFVAWGSGIPLYLKARKAARLGIPPASGLPDPELATQLLEARSQAAEQVAATERNATQLQDLEERVEFMERLLARQREED